MSTDWGSSQAQGYRQRSHLFVRPQRFHDTEPARERTQVGGRNPIDELTRANYAQHYEIVGKLRRMFDIREIASSCGLAGEMCRNDHLYAVHVKVVNMRFSECDSASSGVAIPDWMRLDWACATGRNVEREYDRCAESEDFFWDGILFYVDILNDILSITYNKIMRLERARINRVSTVEDPEAPLIEHVLRKAVIRDPRAQPDDPGTMSIFIPTQHFTKEGNLELGIGRTRDGESTFARFGHRHLDLQR